jgi:hypothetical protein
MLLLWVEGGLGLFVAGFWCALVVGDAGFCDLLMLLCLLWFFLVFIDR